MNVICYIDGFNLYHGLRSKGWRKYYWLDLWALAERFLKRGQTLVEVVYCTTLIKDDPPGQQRPPFSTAGARGPSNSLNCSTPPNSLRLHGQCMRVRVFSGLTKLVDRAMASTR